jgi:hypothetical protein
VFLGDARKEAFRDRAASYAARLEVKIASNADAGEYRCVRIFAHYRLDDWDFTDVARLDLTVRVESVSRRLEVTTSEFL